MAENIDLGFAIGLEPEQASEYLKAKGYAISWDWYDTWQEGHRKAFTVAKATQMDVLQDIREMVEKARKDGLSFETFQKELEPKLFRKGWWGREIVDKPGGGIAEVQLGSPERLNTIYRTNMAVAYSAGRYRDQIENVDERPYWQYNAVMDIATRPSHAALNGFVFRYDDPFWQTHYPPCDWGCRCKVRALTAAQIKANGLDVFSGVGKLHEETVEIAKGVSRQVTKFKGYGAEMTPGPGWNYNPGDTDYAPDLPKYTPPVVKEFKAAEAGRGYAKENKVRSMSDISTVMKAYHEDNPGIFHRGFKGVEVVKNEDYFMATDSHGAIYITDKTLPEFEGWNPAQDLKKALSKIGRGQDLSFNEEYSIEALWHETLHNRARGRDPIPQSGAKRQIMETLNQFVARHTYPEFLESLGGLESHGEAILTQGYGYNDMVTNFRAILSAAGINEVDALDPLKEVTFYSKWSELPHDLAEALAKLYGDPKAKLKFMRTFHLLNRIGPSDIDQVVKDILAGP